MIALSTRLSLPALVSFVVSLFAFLGTALSVFVWNPTGLLSWYSLFIFGTLIFFSIWAMARSTEENPALPKWEKIFIALLFLAALYTRFLHIGGLALWADEDNQDWFLFRYLDIAQRAAWAQQPPLHHFLSLPLVKWLDQKLIAIRFFPALFGAAAVPLFYLFLRRTCRSFWPPLVGAVLFFTNGWLVSFAKEGKPNSMSVFLTVLLLYALHDFWRCPREQEKARGIALLAASSLFFLSIGIQPILVGGAVTGAFALVALARGEKRKALAIAGNGLLALLILAPFLSQTIRISNQFGVMKYRSPWAFFTEDFIGEWGRHFEVWQQLLVGLGPLLVLVPFGCSLFLRRRERMDFRLPFLLSILLLLPIGLIAYGLFVKVNLPTPRYFLVYLPFFLALAVYAFEELLKTKLRTFFSACALVFAAYAAYASWQMPLQKPTEEQIPALYDYFRQNEMREAEAFYFTLNRFPPGMGKFMQNGFHGKDYYYDQPLAAKVSLESQYDNLIRFGAQSDRLLAMLEKNPNPSDIFFYSLDRENDANFEGYKYSPSNQPLLVRIGPKPAGDWAASLLIHLPNRAGFRATVKQFLLDIDQSEPDARLKQKAIALLAVIASLEKNCPAAEKYIRRIEPGCFDHPGFCFDQKQLELRYNEACPR